MVAPLEIYVDGKGSSFRVAERGYLRLSVTSTSTDQSQAISNVQSAAATITALCRPLATKTEDGLPHVDAAVTAFTVTPLSTVSQYQRDQNYRQLLNRPKEHTVTASSEIIFRDMAKLADVSNELACMAHVSVSEIEWRLTDATRAQLEREARVKAITDAVHKAQDYAGVVGRQVIAVEIKDQPQAPGLYGAYAPAYRNQPMMQQMMQQQAAVHQQLAAQQAAAQQGAQHVAGISTSASEGLTLEPKTIAVFAQVSAKFVSRDDVGCAGRKRSRQADDVDV
ncbi:hypothetical protein NEMBOFW57_008187 [Staphylotrichum longicolle]|uniref:Uncharacterized protein n=1 Tax=Staphylotrichum longicolle TaxID=669026 RepID=A0AAD4EV25_9PEZI|nr:hypothetical protein NEMBOFW57_008187 [Staphylotrichum longicolle]